MANKRLHSDFFTKDVLEVAQKLPGKVLARKQEGKIHRFIITEVEAYRGEEDLACHASKGRTKRTEVMYHKGGSIYVYLIYGMYWMLNFVTGMNSDPQAVLIRGLCGTYGPGRVGRLLRLDRSFYGEDIETSERLWVEDNPSDDLPGIQTAPRIGIDYSGDVWKNKKWRFFISEKVVK